MILVIDNYDSFVYTLNGYLQQLGAETTVVRNDDFSVDDAAGVIADYDAVLLSPGPGAPAGGRGRDAGRAGAGRADARPGRSDGPGRGHHAEPARGPAEAPLRRAPRPAQGAELGRDRLRREAGVTRPGP